MPIRPIAVPAGSGTPSGPRGSPFAAARRSPASVRTGSASPSATGRPPTGWPRPLTGFTAGMPDRNAPASFAVPLDVAGRRVLVCGGGPTALGPVRALLEARAEVFVVGAEIGLTIRDLEARRLLSTQARPVEASDLVGTALVVPATGDRDADAEVAGLARSAGVLATSPRTPDAPTERSEGAGEVVLVGGGPGNLDLLTLGGLAAIRRADVIVTDRLAPLAALDHARPDALVIDVAKIPRGASTSQEQINRVLVEQASAGRTVVRFKGGDSFVLGRGGEEWQACAAAGIPVTVLPGVSSATAGPALAGIPLTHRDLTQGFTVVSGHLPPGAPGSTLDCRASSPYGPHWPTSPNAPTPRASGRRRSP